MKDYTIFVDLDGVITDFVGDTAKLYGISREEIYCRLCQRDLAKELGVNDKAMWEEIRLRGEEFWSEMTEYDWATHLYKQLSFLGNVIFLSSPGLLPAAYSGKAKWLERRIENYDKHLIFTDKKYLLAGRHRILIDDYLKQVDLFQEYGGIGICFPQPWNLSCPELRGLLVEPGRTHKIIEKVKQIVKGKSEQLTLPFHHIE